MRSRTLLWSFNYAIEGIVFALRTQRNMRLHFVAATLVFTAALLFHVTRMELMALVLVVAMVLVAELANTAIEAAIDVTVEHYDPLAKVAKDVAAGAVLVASIGAVIMGYLALSRFFSPPELHESSRFLRTTGNLAMVAVVLVVLLVVLLKARLGSGTPLHGGMPSGHAAVACSIATSVAFAAPGLPILALAWLLAILVGHSRIMLGVHNLTEVVAGSLLGTGVAVTVHLAFS